MTDLQCRILQVLFEKVTVDGGKLLAKAVGECPRMNTTRAFTDAVRGLERDGLAKYVGGHWQLTSEGQAAVLSGYADA